MSSPAIIAADALLQSAEHAETQSQPQDALAAYNEVIQQFEQETSPEIQERVATALYNKAMLLSELEDSEQEIETYQALEKRFGTHTSESIRLLVAEGLINLSYTFQDHDRQQEAITACQTIIGLYSQTTSADLQEYVEKATDLIQEWTEA